MLDTPLTTDDIAAFHRDGFIVMPHLFDTEEIDLLGKIARADQLMAANASGRRDGEGGTVKLSISNELEEDVYAAFVRCPRLAGTMEQLLGGEVYHYHHKMILKEPLIGGAWEWHQDYGYWYNNGCLFPDMASCMVAVDRSTQANGCLQVLRGSHLMGRVNHITVGDQTGADPERVAVALERLELVYVELEPGSAVFFHSNLLHRSDQNKSVDPRWTLIACYNMARNDPYKESHHPRYSPLERWPEERIKELGQAQWEKIRSKV